MNNIYLFMEEKLIKIALSLVAFILCVMKFFFVEQYNDILVNLIGKHLATENNSIITVATVFIGIYFTMYTIFTTIDKNSVLAALDKGQFKKLLKILGIGFFSSSIYVIFGIISSWLFDKYPGITSIILIFTVVAFFSSTLVLGVLLYYIIKMDIFSIIETVRQDKIEEQKINQTLKRLSDFLDKEEKKELLNEIHSLNND